MEFHQKESESLVSGVGEVSSSNIFLEVAHHRGTDESVLELLKFLFLVRTPCERFVVLCQGSQWSGGIPEIENDMSVLGA